MRTAGRGARGVIRGAGEVGEGAVGAVWLVGRGKEVVWLLVGRGEGRERLKSPNDQVGSPCAASSSSESWIPVAASFEDESVGVASVGKLRWGVVKLRGVVVWRERRGRVGWGAWVVRFRGVVVVRVVGRGRWVVRVRL